MSSHSISRTLSYNEEKVTLGKAECLTAANFLKDLSHLSREDKLRCFQRRMDLNERVSTSLHITLNFDPSDKISNAQMKQIAALYMQGIGFERQPYLVYRHHDAGHPHCHIVTTHILPNGDPMDLYNIGRNQSETARHRIEAEFHLVTPETKQHAVRVKQHIDGLQRIKYGENATTPSISKVVEQVTGAYKYTSLEELNTVLRLYNVEACRGKENSQLYRNRGLLYRVLDEHGKYIGVPIKASFFDFKPTLTNLETKFAQNQPLKEEYRQHVGNAVRYALFQNPQDLEGVAQDLGLDNIHMALRLDKAGNCNEVSFVDLRRKCVFSGHELGDRCDQRAIQNVLDRQKALEMEEQRQKHHLVHRRGHSLRR